LRQAGPAPNLNGRAARDCQNVAIVTTPQLPTADSCHTGSLDILTMRRLSPLTILGIRLATLVLVLYWVLLFSGTHIPSPPTTGLPSGDKTQHFIAFFGLATLLCWAIPTQGHPLRKIVFVLAIAIPYAAFDEWSQRFVPRRQVDIEDFYTNALGILAATACYATVRWLYLKLWRRSRTEPIAGPAGAMPPRPQAALRPHSPRP
jgi:VanZ family protein